MSEPGDPIEEPGPEPTPSGSPGFFTPNNKCNCQVCESCVKNTIVGDGDPFWSDQCELIVNQRRVTKIIWEIISISDPWERWVSFSSGTYMSVPGTTALIGEYVVDLETTNDPTFSPRGCNSQYIRGGIAAVTGVYYQPDEDPEDIPGNLGVAFTSIGTDTAARFTQSLLLPVFDVVLLQLPPVDICIEVPPTTFQFAAPIDRGSTTVWRMRHGFD